MIKYYNKIRVYVTYEKDFTFVFKIKKDLKSNKFCLQEINDVTTDYGILEDTIQQLFKRLEEDKQDGSISNYRIRKIRIRNKNM